MSKSDKCNRIQEAIAAGDALGADDAAHVEYCAACRAVADTASGVRERWPDRSAELAAGFRARFRAGGHARVERRARRRRAGVVAGAAVAAGAVWVVLWARPEPQAETGLTATVAPPIIAAPPERAPKAAPEPPFDAPSPAELDALLVPAARWEVVEAPLEPYRRLADAVPSGGAP